ncbi:LytTR family transcriptional regulator [Roseobacter sp. YSTF-M11]|uniref:LytTR family transcriptional regulator n=1 Tax=Roseobacter insulae TaxID=2859783 RepID=A0A9X1FSH2_9RHOB|nr:LytTR family DNA-binding domain-containing protein [Roseobacter insulae]MBW4706895.1 LytTR family transcriptional regulator [Roseobacter insulae]
MPSGFVNDTAAVPAMREVREVFSSRKCLTILALAAFMAGFFGPFGTYSALATVERYAYWAVIVGLTAPVGYLAIVSVERLLPGPAAKVWRLPVCTALAGIPICAIVLGIARAFGLSPTSVDAATIYGQCTLVILCLSCLFSIVEGTGAQTALPRESGLIKRLPGAKRGTLIRISAQDHYVEVVTDKGTTLLPMRFRDAMAETAPVTGAQVHRSHWIALHAVTGSKRIRGRPGFVMSDGSLVPIGRTFVPHLRDRGIL